MGEAVGEDVQAWSPSGARIAIVGLGLIGGSLARDLAALGAHILGFDADAGTLQAALDAGAVREPLPRRPRAVASRGGNPATIPPVRIDPGLLSAARLDALVLAVPLQAAVSLLAELAPYLSHVPLVTDAGSTKRTIAAAARRLGLAERFVGAHPLAGSHLSGWGASREGLFRGARIYLCPGPEAGHVARQRAYALWTAVGGVPEILDAAAHDRLLAWTSHLPQAASTALARALAAAGVRPGDLGPGGRGMTRLAASSPSLWAGIALDNAPALAEGLAALEKELSGLRDALERGDQAAVHDYFSGGLQHSSDG